MLFKELQQAWIRRQAEQVEAEQNEKYVSPYTGLSFAQSQAQSQAHSLILSPAQVSKRHRR